MAKEVQDVIRCALQVMRYYGIEDDVKASIDKGYAFAAEWQASRAS